LSTVSVIVTTYRRPRSLAACLEGLRGQVRRADELLVVVHEADDESARHVDALATSWPALRRVPVASPGFLAALNAGLAAATQEIVAFVDDDAVASPEWIARLEATFACDTRIAGAGGRDIVSTNGRIAGREGRGILGRYRGAPPVGRIQWFGRQIGNHHIGTGAPRDVDVLKGVNMAFRRSALSGRVFDQRLRGTGTQVHTELSLCLPLRRRGLRLVYDPAIVVHHYPAPRSHGHERAELARDAIFARTYNEALQVLDYLPAAGRAAFAAWRLGFGTADAPGLANLARLLVTGAPAPGLRFVTAQRALLAAWRTHRAGPHGPHRARVA
jgi:glycosyltransferase involved in cell wall biosynthesis